MKSRITCLFMILFLAASAAAQDNMQNFNYLLKDTALLNQVRKGNYPYAAIEIGAKAPYSTIQRTGYPIKIAIDPGHVASTKKEAIMEERYINSKDGFFFESELTMATALLLKSKLEARGFQVMITRPDNMTALGQTYTQWYRKSRKQALCEDLERGAITREQYEELIVAKPKTLFERYFRDKDFIARSHKINAFDPDITLVIHYNASEFKNSPKTYTPSVDHNYSVAFVPGGFTNNEILAQSQTEDFIRLASTDLVPRSIMLSAFIIEELNNKLNAPSLLPDTDPDLWYLKKYSVYTQKPGVFSRNLYMTRAIKSPICYAECLLQNNRNEVQALVKRDLKVGSLKVSSRTEQVADACYAGIIKYFIQTGAIR